MGKTGGCGALVIAAERVRGGRGPRARLDARGDAAGEQSSDGPGAEDDTTHDRGEHHERPRGDHLEGNVMGGGGGEGEPRWRGRCRSRTSTTYPRGRREAAGLGRQRGSRPAGARANSTQLGGGKISHPGTIEVAAESGGALRAGTEPMVAGERPGMPSGQSAGSV